MIRPPGWLTRARSAARESPEEFFSQGRPLGAGRRESAVLLLVAPGDPGTPGASDADAHPYAATDTGSTPPTEIVVLTERAPTLRAHAGQIAFPGGAVDPTDSGPVATAVREAQEEVGVDPARLEILTTFPPVFVPASDSAVSTVLAWSPGPLDLRIASPAEVTRVLRVPLAALADPAHRFTVTHPVGYSGPGFEVERAFIWGFTALMLDRLLVLGGLARPWDEGVTRLLPDRVSGGRPPVVLPPVAPPVAPSAGAHPNDPAGRDPAGNGPTGRLRPGKETP